MQRRKTYSTGGLEEEYRSVAWVAVCVITILAAIALPGSMLFTHGPIAWVLISFSITWIGQFFIATIYQSGMNLHSLATGTALVMLIVWFGYTVLAILTGICAVIL